jgi:hypothetical protein
MAILGSRPQVGLVHCACRITDEAGRTKRVVLPQDAPEDAGLLFDEVRLGTYPVTGSSSAVLVRRAVLDDVGLFAEDVLVHEDWEMWSRMARVTGFAASGKVLVSIRELDGSHSRQRMDPTEKFLAKLRVLDRWGDDDRFIDMAVPVFRSEATYWQIKSLRFSPMSVLWEFRRRLREDGGAVGRRLFPSAASYYLSLAGLPLEIAKRAMRRLIRDNRSSAPRLGA